MITQYTTEICRGHLAIALKRLFDAIVVLIIMCGMSCKSRPIDGKIERGLFLSAWQSKNITAKERVDAANKWITAGTDGETVVSLLGLPKTGWNHFHGSTVGVVGKPGPPFDFWELVYPCSNNRSVAFVFNPAPNSSEFRVLFDHAFVIEAPVSH